jgi:hypothetical protein
MELPPAGSGLLQFIKPTLEQRPGALQALPKSLR